MPLRRILQGLVITADATIHIAGSISRGEFKVLSARPRVRIHESSLTATLYWLIAPNTQIKLVEVPSSGPAVSRNVPDDRNLALSLVEDIKVTLHESIVWPVLHAKDATSLGVKFPRGILLHGPPGVGKSSTVQAVAAKAGVAVYALSASDIFGPYAGDSEARLRSAFMAVKRGTAEGNFTLLMLDEIDAICPSRSNPIDGGLHSSRVVAQLLTLLDGALDKGETDVQPSEGGSELKLSKCVFNRQMQRTLRPVVVATTNRPNTLDAALRRPGRFDIEVELALPTEQERLKILQLHSQLMFLGSGADLNKVAVLAKGYSGADLACLCREATMSAFRRSAEIRPKHSVVTPVEGHDFTAALDRIQASVMRNTVTELPRTSWNAIGGLDIIKERLNRAVVWPLKYSHAFVRLGLSPHRGILLHGPSGCAKTTLARAIATTSGATVVALTAADIFDKYVGIGEKVIRDAFDRARRTAPAILILDEVDGMIGSRSTDGADTLAARVLAVLLTEMDGLEAAGKNVVIVATTNRPSVLDTALLRPGRFDLVLYTPPLDVHGRQHTLMVHANGVPLASDVDFNVIAARAARFTGAELQGLVREATLSALREDMKSLKVGQRHFMTALAEVKASISETDLVKWESFESGRAAYKQQPVTVTPPTQSRC